MTSFTARAVHAVVLCLVPATAHAQAWFTDRSDALQTDRYSFDGSNAEAGDTNENYYDGDFADIDGDGRLDRGMISRYGLLWNAAGGLMTPIANTVQGATYQFGDKDAIGNDAICWADVDGDGDPDSIQGGNGEALTLQINQATRFSIKWRKSGSSAKRIVKIDLERDGDVDLVVAGAFCLTRNCGQPDDFTVWVNDGTGQFTDETLTRGLDYRNALIAGVSAGDVDGDGDFDLVVASGTRRRIIALINNGAGVFSERPFFVIPDALWTYQTGAEPTIGLSGSDNTALGDLDGDGDLDLVVGAFGPIGGHPTAFYPLFINDGAGNFTEQAATRFRTGTFTGKLYGTDIKLADFDADGDLDLAAYSQTGFADLQGNHLQLYVNDGAGTLTFTRDLAPGFTPPTGGINAFDVADYTGDGATDLWIGNQGGRVLAFVNTEDPQGTPADQPRNLRVVSATAAGVRLAWQPPTSAATVRFFRVHRDTRPGLPLEDRVPVKTVAISPHADDSFVAPITRRTTAAQLGDPTVTVDPADGTLQWVDTTATPGITWHYSVVQVGHETKLGTPTPEVAATIPGADGVDAAPPQLTIVGPTRQHWQATPRIVLQYADGQSGVDPGSVRISFDAAIAGRAAGADVSDLATWKDARLFVAALVPPAALPLNTLITMTASVADVAGNRTTKTIQFFVAASSARLPTASFAATPMSGDAPLDVAFDGAASTDPDGKVVRYEWYFGDGEMASGLGAAHRYQAGGTYVATLVVRDTQGGAASTTRTITVSGAAPECMAGETRDCYTGAGGTRDVGVCVAGNQSCAAGAWPASCAGEVLPLAETCDDDLDQDCDGLADANDPDCGATVDEPAGCGCGASQPAAMIPLALTLLGLLPRRRTAGDVSATRGARLGG